MSDEPDYLTQAIGMAIQDHFDGTAPDDQAVIKSLLRVLCFVMSELSDDDDFIISSITKNMPELLAREREFTKDIPRPRPKPSLTVIDGSKLN